MRQIWKGGRKGRALGKTGLREAAAAEFKHAVAVDPEDGRAWLGLGTSLLELNRLAEAVEALRRATDLAPKEKMAWVMLGTAYAIEGKLDEALKCLIVCRRLAPDDKGTLMLQEILKEYEKLPRGGGV